MNNLVKKSIMDEGFTQKEDGTISISENSKVNLFIFNKNKQMFLKYYVNYKKKINNKKIKIAWPSKSPCQTLKFPGV